MVSYKSKYLSKALLIFVIFTFFVQHIHCFYVMSFALKRPNYSVYYCQWRKSVKIIGGDETEPTKVALIKKRIVA